MSFTVLDGCDLVGFALLDGCDPWIANSWYGDAVLVSPCSMAWYGAGLVLLCGARLRVAISVLGWCDMVLGGCFAVVLVFGFRDGETEMEIRDKRDMVLVVSPWYGFWVRRWRDRDERGETETREERQRRESQIKYYYFFRILATVQFYV